MNTKDKSLLKKILKGIVIAGTGIYCGNLFACVVPAEQGALAKGAATIAGTAVGGWIGLEASNAIEYRLTEAAKKLEAKRAAETEEVRVNG